jgi:hypothetical protein
VDARIDFGRIRGWFPHHGVTNEHLLTAFMLTLLAGLGTALCAVATQSGSDIFETAISKRQR